MAGSLRRCLIPSGMPAPFATRQCRFLSQELLPSCPLRHRMAGSLQGCPIRAGLQVPFVAPPAWVPPAGAGSQFPRRALRAAPPLPPEVPLPRVPGAGAAPGAELQHRARPSPPTRDEVIGEAAEIEARRRRRRQRRCSPGRGSPRRARRTMTERCSLWSALSAAACCFYRGSFMQVQVSGGGAGTRGTARVGKAAGAAGGEA